MAEPDYLDEDDPIRGQTYAIISFLSPEKVLQNKDRYFFNEFLKDYEITWKTKNLEKYLAETMIGLRKILFDEADRLDALDLSAAALKCKESAKALNIEKVLDSYKAFIDKNKREISVTKINSEYDDFMYKNGDTLEDTFYRKNECHTTIRGVKIRGVYATMEECQVHAKKLQRKDKYHDILLADVGKWVPWDPTADKIPDREYANEQLNSLMKEYNKNTDAREEFYRENPEAKKAKGVKSMINMTVEPNTATVNTVVVPENVTEATKALFDGPADLALARKMETSAKI